MTMCLNEQLKSLNASHEAYKFTAPLTERFDQETLRVTGVMEPPNTSLQAAFRIHCFVDGLKTHTRNFFCV